jgi:hypothetical protein
VSNRRPSKSEKIKGFLERTDPLAVQAIRKIFSNHSRQPTELTIEERAALDEYLEPRLEALVDGLMARMLSERTAPYGPPRGRGWTKARRSRAKSG